MGVEVWLDVLLTFALDGSEFSVSSPCRFTPKKTATVTGSWMDSRKGLGTMKERKIPCLYVESNFVLSHPACSLNSNRNV
jgi:hypothetical protein